MTAKTPKDAAFFAPMSLDEKLSRLRASLRSMSSVVVAYSGGVDSSFLSYVANDELGENAVCVLGVSPSVSAHQRLEAVNIAEALGLNFRTVDTDELKDPNYVSNNSERCYFCKSELYERLELIAKEMGVDNLVDGTNFDDLADVRPGRNAALEIGVISPLADTGLTKAEIRELSRMYGVGGWDRPASPCLSSRVAHGVPVTIGRLSKIEKGEQFLRELGFVEFRVRVHGDLARIEVSRKELDRMLDASMFERVSKFFKAQGYKYTTLDMEGFRTGSLNG